MRARVSNLAKTESEWLKLTFIPMSGELVIYLPDANYKYPRIKIGDGEHTVHELPFAVESTITTALNAYSLREYADAGRITNYFT